MQYLKLIGVIVAITVMGSVPQPSAAANEYFFRDLGTLGGSFSKSLDINDLGQVVGFSSVETQDQNRFSERIHAFLWDHTAGMLDLDDGSGENLSMANNIDNFGQVFGTNLGSAVADTSLNMELQAFKWHKSRGRRGADKQRGWFNKAYRVNVHGQMVGFELTPNDDSRAVLWNRDRVSRDLGTLPGHVKSMAFGINNLGQVVGYSKPNRNAGLNRCRAFRWDERRGMKPVGPSEVYYSVAKDINDAGQILGEAVFIDDGFQAFIWDPSNGTQLLSEMVPFDPMWKIVGVSAINNLGQITGDASFDVDGDGDFDEIHAFLLTPRNIGDIEILIMMSLDLLPPKEGAKLTSNLKDAIKKLGEGKTAKTFEILSKYIKEVDKLNAKEELSGEDRQALVNGAHQVQASLVSSAVFFKFKDLISDLVVSLPENESEKLTKILQKALEELAEGKPDKTRHKLEEFIKKVDDLINKGELSIQFGQEIKSFAADIIGAV